MPATKFEDLSNQLITRIIGYLPENTKQRIRRVCSWWNILINDEFPLQIEINNNNLPAMLRRGNAYSVIIKDLTAEIHENIEFATRVRQLEAVGKIVTSNLVVLLKICKNINILTFTSLKEIMSIESMEVVEIPKVSAVQIKIRGEHQMFTLAELILIDWMLKRLRFVALETVIVKVCSLAEIWAQSNLDGSSSQGFSEDNSASTIYNLSREFTAASSGIPSLNLLHPIPAQRNLTAGILLEGNEENSVHESLNDNVVAENNSAITDVQLNLGESNDAVLSANTSRATETTGPEENTSESNTDSMYSYSRQSIFDGTMNRLERRFERYIEDDNDSMNLNEDDNTVGNRGHPMNFYIYGGGTAESAQAAVVSSSVFIRFLLKYFQTLKQLIVITRSDFLCLGNIAEFTLECNKLQFENLEYNFGRSIVYMEFMLLKAQRKLTRIRIQLMEDMIVPFLIAVRSSSATLKEIDVKIIAFHENREPFQYMAFSQCKSLLSLKILHFSGKAHLDMLPVSIERLLMNGPLSPPELKVIATHLVNLKEFNLLLNMNAGIINVELYKTFLKLPLMRMLSFVQCDIDLDAIQTFANSCPGLEFAVEGPRNINMLPDIQYVVTVISPSFNRELLS